MQELTSTLLQYVGQCGSWSPALAATSAALGRLSERQVQSAAMIAELLAERGWPARSGNFPMEYGDLQFLSLSYLGPRLLTDQQAVVADLDDAAHAAVDDVEAAALLNRVFENERQILVELRETLSAEFATQPAVA